MRTRRPSCAGYYEVGHPECDGNPDRAEQACRYRERCLLLIRLGGGPEKMGERDPENNTRVLSAFNDDALSDYLRREGERRERSGRPSRRAREREQRREREAAQRALSGLDGGTPAPTPRPYSPAGGRPTQAEAAVRVGRPTPARKQAPRPVDRYAFTLPILDALADRLSSELGARRVPENDPRAQVGDVFVHYTKTASGRRVIVFRCVKGHGGYHHRLFSVWLRAADPWVDLTLHTRPDSFLDAVNLRPPHGLGVSVRPPVQWGEPVRVEGVTPALIPETATWLARVYGAGLFLLPRET